MATLELKGLHQVRKRNADGAETWHVYAWRGGPKIASRPRRIAAADAELIEAFQRAHNRAGAGSAPAAGKATLGDLLMQWQASAEFRGLSANSKKDYRLQAGKIEAGFWRDEAGRAKPVKDIPQAGLADPRIRGVLLGWRDQALAHQPRTADKVMATLSAAFGWAVNRGGLAHNPLAGWRRLHSADRSLLIWADDDLDALQPHCSGQIWRAVQLAAASGLALCDLCALPWAAIKDGGVDWRRKKTGKDVLIPIYAELQRALADCPRESTIVLTNGLKRPWSVSGLGHKFGEARDAASVARPSVKALRFHDLRGTAATRFLRSGLSYPQVAMIMGWDDKSVEKIAKKYVNRAHIIAGMVAKIDG